VENSSLSINLKNIATKQTFGVFLALLAIWVFFSITTDAFLSVNNFINILRQSSVIGIIAIAMTMLITSQEFDLSVGSMFALSGVILGFFALTLGINQWLALLLTFAFAIIVGLVNGMITLKIGIPSFITTLGTMMLLRGGALVLSGGYPVSGFRNLTFIRLVGGRFLGLPVMAIWFLIITVIGYIIMNKTKLGYKMYATGGNTKAARLSGINTDKIKLIGFVLTSVSATIACLTSIGFLGMVSPTQGQGFELEVIAASVVGGTALFGGSSSIVGAFLGAIIMGSIKNGLSIMGTSAYLQQAFIGLVVIIAVIINVQFQDD